MVIEIIPSFFEKDITELKILEIGAGRGLQSKVLCELGFNVTAIDIPDSNYADNRVFDIINYNGMELPFPDDCFDVVFSSNVLEHIVNIKDFQFEMQRVLVKEGIGIHVLPSASWRFNSNVSFYFAGVKKMVNGLLTKKLPNKGLSFSKNYKKRSERRLFQKIFPAKHGEIGNAISEIYYFSKFRWVKEFSAANWEIVKITENGLFYTGHALLKEMLSIKVRQFLSNFFGSSCNIFVLKKGDF